MAYFISAFQIHEQHVKRHQQRRISMSITKMKVKRAQHTLHLNKRMFDIHNHMVLRTNMITFYEIGNVHLYRSFTFLQVYTSVEFRFIRSIFRLERRKTIVSLNTFQSIFFG